MSKKIKKNMGESVRARLLNFSKETGRDFHAMLLLYCQERFLYRLSISDYKAKFILKGGLLFLAYQINTQRITKDIDFLGRAIANDEATLKAIFKEIASIAVEDGVVLSPDNITVVKIKEDAIYEGLRVNMPVEIARAKLKLQIDVGFGDVVTGGLVKKKFPVLLGHPVPNLNLYSRETSIAEKFEAMVSLEYANSRMKDFYDIHYYAQSGGFDGIKLYAAISKTFKKRGVWLGKSKTIFSTDFQSDTLKNTQWKGFLKRNAIEFSGDFKTVAQSIKKFIEPVLKKEGKIGAWDAKTWRWDA